MAQITGKTADQLFAQGRELEEQGRYEEAADYYEQALEENPTHAPSVFRLGYLHAQRGDLNKAVGFYSSLTEGPEICGEALVNLGLLYEELQQPERAVECFKRMLKYDPVHERAALYLKDAESALRQTYDDSHDKELSRKYEILRTPITDFELSVRSRNCLAKMNIRTLGDLVRRTEQELLSFKNFGETSLTEIKELLDAKGLRLGQEFDETVPAEFLLPPEPYEEEEEEKVRQEDLPVTERSIDELGLSVRSHRCMERLGIETIGELIQHTAEDLLSSKNFGKASLTEVKEKLAHYSLALKESR